MRIVFFLFFPLAVLTPTAIADTDCPPDRLEGSLLTWQSATESGEDSTTNPGIVQVHITTSGSLQLIDDNGRRIGLIPVEASR